MTAILGSEALSSLMYVIAQSLIIPVIAALLIFMVYTIIQVGGILSEYSNRIKTDVNEIEELLNSISTQETPDGIKEVAERSNLPKSHREILSKIAVNSNLGEKSREAFARKLIEAEQINAAKRIEKTDVIAKIGPAIGLMGTLIPLGPGLSALGSGDIASLSQNLVAAFDAAIVGLGAAAVAFTISRIRRRWYEDQLSTLDTLAESTLEALQNAKKKTKTNGYQ
ncbi:MotA/TolQ/ExbB proton channel family protein [Methanobacterium sp. MBAC-LM]|jgi:biopolymer transport protein ExbB/TolQ|uniref:MotA/TolQ/ExbB proton channel family protein n=1 Tax=Methanobacterium sp. MBAC-LM TaxID=3412034 RepID=UPI003C73B1C4